MVNVSPLLGFVLVLPRVCVCLLRLALRLLRCPRQGKKKGNWED